METGAYRQAQVADTVQQELLEPREQWRVTDMASAKTLEENSKEFPVPSGSMCVFRGGRSGSNFTSRRS